MENSEFDDKDENVVINENIVEETTKLVHDKIKKTLEDIKGGKLYDELVESLGLVNKDDFQYLVDLSISLRVYNQAELWNINNEFNDLCILSVTFLGVFYKEIMYPEIALRDIRTLQKNLLTITKWLFSNDKSVLPEIDTKTYSGMLKKEFPGILINVESESGLLKIKDSLMFALVEVLINASFASNYHKQIPDEELKNLEWKHD